MELLAGLLDTLPDLSGGRGSTLSTDEGVDTSTELAERGLNMSALAVTSSEESSVQNNEDPRSALEENSGEENTSPESHLEVGDDSHRSIVVLLDESANLVSKRAVGSLAARRSTISSLGRRLGRKDNGDEVGAGVGGNVEDRVDRVRDQGEGVLGREEPHKGHGKILDVLISKESHGGRSSSGASLCASAHGLVDDNAIGDSGSDKGSTVGELGHAGVVVHSNPGQEISARRKDQGKVSDKPTELEGLGKGQKPLLERKIGVRRGSHCV